VVLESFLDTATQIWGILERNSGSFGSIQDARASASRALSLFLSLSEMPAELNQPLSDSQAFLALTPKQTHEMKALATAWAQKVGPDYHALQPVVRY
jgi:hypothetical protein